MIRFVDEKRQVKLSVHDVIDAGPPKGDLFLTVAWNATTRMRIGTEIHTQYQTNAIAENPNFQKEVTIRHVVTIAGWEVEITGRIDGVIIDNGYQRVEEIKTSTLPSSALSQKDLSDMPHWRSQVELYLYFLAGQGVQATGELVVISVVDGYQHRLPVPHNPDQKSYIEKQLRWLITEREKQIAWYQTRIEAVTKGLLFAHSTWRTGQEEMSQFLERDLSEDKILLVRAPTGYGKTAASLYAALQVAYRTHRKIFFATARNTQQQMVEDTLRKMHAQGVPVRAVSLRAKEKACLNDTVSCRPDRCPYADRYYDKLEDNRLFETIWDEGVILADHLQTVGATHTICPYELSKNLVGSADVVIGDYNYLFDPSVQLGAISQNPKAWIVIVDEAHNLPIRAQGYGSPKLSVQQIWNGIHAVRHDVNFYRFAAPLQKLLDWLLFEVQQSNNEQFGQRSTTIEEGIHPDLLGEVVKEIQQMALEYAVQRYEKPVASTEDGDPWYEAAWSILSFHTALERAGDETVVIWQRLGKDRDGLHISALDFESPATHRDTGLELLCRDPSVLLGAFFERIGSAICMSATLEPFDFYTNLLGLTPERTCLHKFESPFPVDNRASFMLPFVSTLYRDRQREHPRVARLLEKIISSIQGNVAVFFSSFAVLEDIRQQMDLGERPTLVQTRRMREAGRRRLLKKMGKAEGHVLLAVMGGIFSEGVDLPGKALEAAVIIGPSLPQASLSRRLMQQWYEERYGEGFRYAWVIPGMARVSQAAGRVVRTETDRGLVVLVGNRFADPLYRDLFPTEWHLRQTTRLGDEIASFFGYTEQTDEDKSIDATP